MKILFIQPPIQDFYNTKFREYPLGLLYLAGALDGNRPLSDDFSKNFNLGILDARCCNKPKHIRVPDELKYLGKYYTKENNLFLNYKHFGLGFDEISSRVKEFNPDFVCINSMFTTYNAQVIETAKAVKKVNSDCAVIVGGYHATVSPQILINSEFIDTVIRGEGEHILAQIFNSDDADNLKKIQKKILEKDGSPFHIDDLDSLNFPARNLVDALKYTFNKKPYTMILTSRGCPNDCVFCSVHSIAGHGYRKRNIDNVLCEMDECIKRYGIEVFDFQDDNLLFDVDRIKGLLEKMILRYGKRRFELLATNGLNSANIDEELLILMKEAGFNKLDISLATGAVSSRDSFNRPETIGQYESVLEKAVSLGLGVTTYIILGFPEQPLDELKQTINYLKDKKTLISPSVFYNVSGMPIYEKMRKYEYLDSDIARRSTAFNSRGRDFEREDIFNMFSNIRNSNYSIRQG